jgi:hypothetical protein
MSIWTVLKLITSISSGLLEFKVIRKLPLYGYLFHFLDWLQADFLTPAFA